MCSIKSRETSTSVSNQPECVGASHKQMEQNRTTKAPAKQSSEAEIDYSERYEKIARLYPNRSLGVWEEEDLSSNRQEVSNNGQDYSNVSTPFTNLTLSDLFDSEKQYEKCLDRAYKGDAVAMLQLAIKYALGKGTDRNKDECLKWALRAAEKDHVPAMELLGEWYLNGTGPFPQRVESAIHWLKQAGEKGSAHSYFMLGKIYEEGFESIESDWILAADLYANATRLGHVDATYNLASAFLKGKGVRPNWGKAAELFEIAADPGGIPAAGYNLAILYVLGDGGVEKDIKKANRWLKWAIERGDAKAMCQMGVHYSHGMGVEEDDELAFDWFEKAARQGDVQSLSNLGLCYTNGKGAAKNMGKALEYFREAAYKDNPQAAYQYAKLRMEGKHCPKNEREAVELMKFAAEYSSDAKLQLAKWHIKGIGVKKDPSHAVDLIRDAAVNMNNPFAMFELAMCYEKGIGVEEDWVIARGYFFEADALGHPRAKKVVERLIASGRGVIQPGSKLADDMFTYDKWAAVDADEDKENSGDYFH